jgi:hypothetical protein
MEPFERVIVMYAEDVYSIRLGLIQGEERKRKVNIIIKLPIDAPNVVENNCRTTT